MLAFACLSGANGCAGTVQQAVKEATPAAVEGAIEGAKQPDTRNDIAAILADPEIRTATSSLSAAFVAGALDGLSDEQRSAELRRLTDAVVRSMGAAGAKALRDDIGPQLSKTLADAVDGALEQTLNEQTERRLEALTAAVARGMAQGLGESWTQALPLLILGGLALALLGCIAAVVWLAARLQHYQRASLAREQVVREVRELRLPAKDRAPRSEPAPHAG